jgi:hypothetical protein
VDEVEREADAAGKERRCYFCRELIRDDAQGCAHCGKSQSSVIRLWWASLRGALWLVLIVLALLAILFVYFLVNGSA